MDAMLEALQYEEHAQENDHGEASEGVDTATRRGPCRAGGSVDSPHEWQVWDTHSARRGKSRELGHDSRGRSAAQTDQRAGCRRSPDREASANYGGRPQFFRFRPVRVRRVGNLWAYTNGQYVPSYESLYTPDTAAMAAFEAQQAAHEAARDAAEQCVEVARAIIQGMDKLQ